MKTKKLLSLLLCFVMLFGIFTPSAFADDAGITVYVTLSQYGRILSGKDGNHLACVPVYLEEENPNLDTVLREFHSMYHSEGEAAYSSYEGKYGLAIAMLWNDTSDLFNYQVNGGTEIVNDLNHELKDGYYVDVRINENLFPDTESYTKFDTYTKSAETGEEITLTLYEAGYDENWNMVFSPCADALITVNGEETDYLTDSEGNVTLNLEEEGIYIISATKSKALGDNTVTAISAPVCIVNISEEIDVEPILHTLAEKYSSDEEMSDGNALWFAADIADYGKIYEDTSYCLSEESKQAIADYAIDLSAKSNKPGDLAKAIIALRSMGYDAKKAYTEDGELLDIPEKLLKTIETNFEEVSNVYTLSYVIIALGEGEDYAPTETMEALINYAVENNDKWLDMEFGTDALTPMLLALSPYTDLNPQVESAVENGTETLILSIDENGMTGNAPSTALSIVALCALGINPTTVENNGNNLIDGLLSRLNDNSDGFLPSENSFATEQGMRALNAYMLFKNGDRVFDFSDFPMEEIHHSVTPKATVVFETDPESAEVSVNGTKSGDKTFVLEAGTYSYKVSKSGYKSEKDEFEISPEEAENFETITIEVELSKKSSGGGGGGGVYVKPDEKVEDTKPEQDPETVKKTFPDIAENPYKEAIENLAGKGIISGTDTGMFLPDKTVTRAEFTVMISKALSFESGKSSHFSDVKENDWFAPYVISAYESGIIYGVSENSFNPYGTITKEEAAAMVCRAASLCGINTTITENDARNILCQFADYKDISSWAYTSVAFCYKKNILDISELSSTPQKLLTRDEIAGILYNMIKEAKL